MRWVVGNDGVMSPARVLVIDDEPYLVELVATALRYEGYQTQTAGSVHAGLAAAESFRPDLVVLDIRLPDGSGLESFDAVVRRTHGAPVIFLTALDAPEDRIAGLRNGAADYVTKPFSLEELVLRVAAVLRRTGREERPARIAYADLVIDDAAHRVTRGGTPVDLTPTEYRLLHYLVSNAERVLTKRQILDHVWQYDFGGNDAVVQTYMSYLRAKVDRGRTPLLRTIARIGYVVREQ